MGNFSISLKRKINQCLPNSIKSELKRIRRKQQWKGNTRIFCISMQRTGTTSVGDFFKYFGYPSAGSGVSIANYWQKYWNDGDYESIFNSKDFMSYQVFEDHPWWYPEFYKVLYHKFPNAKFILLIRDSKSWFNSILTLSEGKTYGNTKRHCKIYRREKEYYNKLDTDSNFNPCRSQYDNLSGFELNNILEIKGHEEHYKSIYEIRNREIIEFFNLKNSKSFIVCNLNDKNKWKKIGKFVGIDVPKEYEIHSNKTIK